MKYINALFLTINILLTTLVNAEQTPLSFVQQAQIRVNQAILGNDHWDGPTAGPDALSHKTVFFIASDLRNGGVNAVAKGISEAVSHLDWNLRFLDGMGSEVRQGAEIRKAIGFLPDGIILGGIDAARHVDVIKKAESLGIKVIGWHASNEAKGSSELGLFTNITTDPASVAEIAALLAVADAHGKAKVVIFTDPKYSIASLKSDRMIEYINACEECEVLAIKEVPLEQTAKRMPLEVAALLEQYPDEITHFLVINDLYIDFAAPSLETGSKYANKIPDSISAGDGSRAAYIRISNDNYQIATVPEPLNMQGWQIIDELNRAFHHLEPSGYSAPVHLVTSENVSDLVGKSDIYDPENGYRDAYLTIWNK